MFWSYLYLWMKKENVCRLHGENIFKVKTKIEFKVLAYFLRIHLQLSTKALASSSREFPKATVRQSVMLKKCFSRPMNVD